MSTSTIPWRKRSIDSEFSDSPIENKRPRTNCWYFRLESESSVQSEDDTESVDSVQGKETDIVKDTSDTETKSEYEVEIEYDLASLSGSDRDEIVFGSSSDSEDMMIAAAVVCDSSLEAFITDAEDSDNSRQDDSSSGLTDYWTCIQCKSQNDNPQFRFCDKCFQDRKTFFPPRPRRHKKAKRTQAKSHSPVKLDALQSCLSGLSQDSGIGSSQEFPSLCLDQIVVPQHLNPDPAKPSTSVEDDSKSRKRQISESSLSEDYEVQRPKKQKTAKKEENGVLVSEDSRITTEKSEVKGPLPECKEDNEVKGPLPECKEICIMCNEKPKNSVFLHGRIAHMCCCYKCAMRTWRTFKRCPICKRKVSNVVRVYTT